MSGNEKTTASRLANFKVPHTYVLIFSMIILAGILTYLIPAGQYERVTNAAGVKVINAASYHTVDANPVGFMDIFAAVPAGLKSSATLVFFVLILGGAFQILMGTGAIDAAIRKMVLGLGSKELLVIPIFLTTFSLAGATLGTTNECIVFVPIGIMIAKRLGYDRVVGTAMVTLGSAVGFVAGPVNPWNVGIAQGIAELPMYSGLVLRILLLISFLVITSAYIIRYAKKVKNAPELSVVYGSEDFVVEEPEGDATELNFRHVLVILTFAGSLAYIIHGVMKKGWGIGEMTPVFLAMGISGGLIGGRNPSRIAKDFVAGAQTLVFGALIIGIARGILIVLQKGMVLDSMVYGLAHVLQKLPKPLTLIGMYIMHIILNVFIPSGSGQAAATMPIMTPLADLTGVTRQCAVLAFQLGDGITNSCNPTSSNMNGYLSLAKISYPQWLKFITPLIGILLLDGLIFLLVAQAINYGPF